MDNNCLNLNDLPEELLEKIFSFTSSYNDYLNISLVCKKWYRIIEGLRSHDKKAFNECFNNGNIFWNCVNSEKLTPTKRHSHSCCRINEVLYVFGGLSGTNTSYNDLWSLNLNDKIWSRMVTDGSYPSPKAAASLVSFENRYLVLFGGYSHPYQYPLNQQVNFFDELHLYHLSSCTWQLKLFSSTVPKLAGHTASIIDSDKMIVFGGCNGSMGNKTNDVYCLSLSTFEWIEREIVSARPEPRYGHSQVTIDDERVVIVGGCGGPNNLYDDVWLLYWPQNEQYDVLWQKLVVKQTFNAPTQLHCISMVRYGNKLVTLGRLKQQQQSNDTSNNQRKCTCVSNTHPICTTSTTIASSKSQTPIKNLMHLNKTQRNTIKRLEVLQNIASKYASIRTKSHNNCLIHTKLMQVFVLNIDYLLNQNDNDNGNENYVYWSEPISSFCNAPPNTILYSLTHGKNELILFGGIEIDSNLSSANSSSTSSHVQSHVGGGLYIMKAK